MGSSFWALKRLKLLAQQVFILTYFKANFWCCTAATATPITTGLPGQLSVHWESPYYDFFSFK